MLPKIPIYISCSCLLRTPNDLFNQAFPCISTGARRYPREAACGVALQTIKKFLEQKSDVSPNLYLKDILSRSCRAEQDEREAMSIYKALKTFS